MLGGKDSKGKSKPAKGRDLSKMQLEVTVVCARHLPKMDSIGSCDTFMRLKRGDKEMETTVRKNSLSPDFGEIFYFDVSLKKKFILFCV